MKINKGLLTAVIAAIVTIGAPWSAAQAQGVRSPYSKFGYGLLNDNATAAQRQMGGVGYAMNSGRQINVMNPASYSAIDSLTFLFDMGADFTVIRSTEGSSKFKDYGGGLDYITMQFPVAKGLGMSLGLLPYSSVGYSFGSKIENGSSSNEGSGGLNQLNLGVSYRFVKGLSAGVNVSYLFGTIYNDTYAIVNSSQTSLFEQVTQVRDWHIQAGIQYTATINKRHRATIGVVYTPRKTLLGHTWVQKYDINADATPDTLDYTSLRGKFELPETYGVGLSYEYDGRIYGEVDFTYQPWSKAKYTVLEGYQPTKLCDRYRMGAGFSILPAPRRGYLGAITYRVGAYYNRDYMTVNGNNVRDIGISCGLGLPIPSSKTRINVGFEWINRRATPQALVKENYFNITLGVNFNELWFFKNKIR